MTETRAVCLNCMDGRTQIPVITWIRQNYGVAYVDLITEAGMDGYIADSNNTIEEVYRSIRISIDKNQALMIFVVGHFDCRGNPVDEPIHKSHICLAAERIAKAFPNMPVIGLWVNDQWNIEKL